MLYGVHFIPALEKGFSERLSLLDGTGIVCHNPYKKWQSIFSTHHRMHPQQVPITTAVRRMPPTKAATATAIMISVDTGGTGELSAA